MTTDEHLRDIHELQEKTIHVQGELIELVQKLQDKVEKLEKRLEAVIENNGLFGEI